MIGRKISNFHINERIGEGGMGTVYKATDMNLGRTVAIKMLHPHMMKQADAFRRFQNEAQLSARVTHPNVATLLDFQQAEGMHYIVMEYVEGKPLDKVLHLQGKLPEKEAIKITLQILEGLTAAHELGIMHRDLKPGNIMLSKRGFVKLMDFGIARMENTARMTRQNNVIGTLEYLAPELVKGAAPTKQSDLYAVGVMLYEMLSGRTLFEADTEASLMYNIAHTQAEISLPGIDKRLVQVIKKLIHKQASRRYSGTKEVAHDLEKIAVGGKINTLILHQKVEDSPIALPTGIGKGLQLPKMPSVSWKLPSFQGLGLDKVKMPFDLDIKIVVPALLISLLILFLGSRNSSKHSDPGQGEITGLEGPLKEEVLRRADSLENAPRQAFVPFERKPDPVIIEEFEEGTSETPKKEQPEEEKKESPKNKNRGVKHVIKPLEESSSTGNSQQGDASSENQPKDEQSSIKDSEKKESDASSKESKIAEEPAKSRESTELKEKTPIRLNVPEMYLSARFDEPISTETHREGQTFYLSATEALSVGGRVIVAQRAKVRGRVRKIRPANGKKKAFLAVGIEAVQAVNGDWLSLSYPEYSNLSDSKRIGDKVVFSRGQQLNRIRIRPTKLTVYE